MSTEPRIVNDVTGLNPVSVRAVASPTTVEELQAIVRESTGPLSIGGGRFSMGGQAASPGSLHIDMRRLNRVVSFSPVDRTIRVETGIRWCDIQRFIDPHGLAVQIMQTYANFTVGGSLSVNCHGRYVGLGPLVLSVQRISLVLADGSRVEATPEQNRELFFGAIGGYGGLGILVEAELALASNDRLERIVKKMPLAHYTEHFRRTVRDSPDVVLHNADLYPPHYARARCVTWKKTDKPLTVADRLRPLRRSYTLHRYFLWAISETPLGKWRREYLIDPLLYLFHPVHWRNYEAGYDTAELEPPSRRRRTYVLQEYFIPVDAFEVFAPKMAEIFRRHRVNVMNVSVRHARADTGTLLSWAPEDVFAFVVYYKQRVRENAKNRVGVWTRELIDAAADVGGAYYLPYQVHATREQFHRAYPRARELFALKSKLDPRFRLRNVIWDTYYAPMLDADARASQPAPPASSRSDFLTVFSTREGRDGFYRFLQNVYRLYPEDRFHTLIKQSIARREGAKKGNGSDAGADEAIYLDIQSRLSEIKPFLSEIFYAIPSLAKQKREMTDQTMEALGPDREIAGYLEIGSTGRYLSALRKKARIREPVFVVSDAPPSYSPVDILERGGLAKRGRFVPLNDYRPLATEIPDASVGLVTCFIGLHHCPPDLLDDFVRSIARVLRPGGLFLLRDHDVKTPAMDAFVGLAHTVFNAGLKLPWEENRRERRHFGPLKHWIDCLERHGFRDTGRRRLQPHDPTDNTLVAFVREDRAPSQ